MGFFDKLKSGLKKTSDAITERVNEVFSVFVKVDEELFEGLEEALIMADLGMETATELTDELRDRVKRKHITDGREVKRELESVIADAMCAVDSDMKLDTVPSVVLIIGVNGVGKTTSIGKMAAYYKSQGKRVLLAAADTFRAAAIDQLAVWADRAGVDIIKQQEGSDPAAVVYDACNAARARGA